MKQEGMHFLAIVCIATLEKMKQFIFFQHYCLFILKLSQNKPVGIMKIGKKEKIRGK
jgi:hypothetical protein